MFLGKSMYSFSVLQYSDPHFGAVYNAISLITFYIIAMIYNKRLTFFSRLMDYLVYSSSSGMGTVSRVQLNLMGFIEQKLDRPFSNFCSWH